MPDPRQDKVIEALSLGVGVWLACESSSVRMEEFNNWINDAASGPAFKERVHDTELIGQAYKERVEKMRKIVAKHDEAWSIMMKQADHFREFKKKQQAGTQMGMLA